MNLIKSPLNHTGGKYKLLSQLLPLFPKNINTFVDMFCGGGDVSVNVSSFKTISVDLSRQVIKIHRYIASGLINEKIINSFLDSYGLDSDSEEAYLKLRNEYNEEFCPVKLFVLICHSFNNQLRFNKKGEFNIPFGKRTFNNALKDKLNSYQQLIEVMSIKFLQSSVFDFDYYGCCSKVDDFVYFDPPYLITDDTYSSLWCKDDEIRLLELLDELASANIKWGLSNVLAHKGRTNDILLQWSKAYKVHKLSHSYKRGDSEEVFITNY